MFTAEHLRSNSKPPPCNRVGLVAIMAFASRAFADRGLLYVTVSPDGPALRVVRRNRKTMADLLVVRATAGMFGRDVLEKIRSRLDASGLEYETLLTKKRRWLREVRVSIALESSAAASGLAHACTTAFEAIQPEPHTYQVTYYGPFNPHYLVQNHDPVALPWSLEWGMAVGRVLGKLIRVFKT